MRKIIIGIKLHFLLNTLLLLFCLNLLPFKCEEEQKQEDPKEDPKVTLNCLIVDNTFEITIEKNSNDYVAIYAKGFESYQKDSRCWKYDDDTSNSSFIYTISLGEIEKGETLPCGIEYFDQSDTYFYEFYVSTTAMILTSKSILYKSQCKFSKSEEYHKYRVTNGIDGFQNNKSNTRTSDEKDERIRNYSLIQFEQDENLEILVYSEEKKDFVKSLEVGEQARFVLIDKSSMNPPFDNDSDQDQFKKGKQRIQLKSECNLYSSQEMLEEYKYSLTDYSGCSLDSNKLFKGGLKRFDLKLFESEDASASQILPFGFQSELFETPFYSSSQTLFFECYVDRCGIGGEECVQTDPNCVFDDAEDADAEKSRIQKNFSQKYFNQKNFGNKERILSNLIIVTNSHNNSDNDNNDNDEYFFSRNIRKENENRIIEIFGENERNYENKKREDAAAAGGGRTVFAIRFFIIISLITSILIFLAILIAFIFLRRKSKRRRIIE